MQSDAGPVEEGLGDEQRTFRIDATAARVSMSDKSEDI
jgi:hypothetical protein